MMTEKLALAMAAESGVSHWKYVSEDGEYDSRAYWRKLARAALTALLEPSEGMVRAAEIAGWDDANHMPAINMHAVSLRAAIQAALDEREEV